jgi:YD repeat-containing protein
MQKNKNMKLLFSLLVLSIFSGVVHAQLTDVFQNKEYFVSTNVLSAEIDKEYTPSKIEILQDKNKEANLNWKNIEEQLYALALSQIKNDVAFFQLHTKAINFQKQIEKQQRIRDEYSRESKSNPTFESIEIQLVSVLNNYGTYILQYNFGNVKVRNYILADYQRNKITSINSTPNLPQQEILKQLTLSKFATLYLLQTKKLDLKNVERIRASQSGSDNLSSFSNHITYSEALVYPYFNGLMVEFSANSSSSAIFENEAFRILIKGKELNRLLAVYPEFRPVFQMPLQRPSDEVFEALNNDANFDLKRLRGAPKDLDLIEKLYEPQIPKNLFSVTINNYQHHGDTIKRFMGARKYFYDKSGNIARMEQRNEQNTVAGEETYSYDSENNLTAMQVSGSGAELILRNYENGVLDYIETIEISDYQAAYGEETRELDISQSHYAYNQNHRYILSLNVVGDLDVNRYVQIRHIGDKKYCINNLCLLTDDFGNVIAVRDKSYPIDLLMNEKNQPIESFFDNDRDRYAFTYDDQDRLITFSAFSSGNRTVLTEYNYHENEKKPVIILETRPSYVISQEIELEF